MVLPFLIRRLPQYDLTACPVLKREPTSVKSPFGVCVATPVKRKTDRFNGVKILQGTAGQAQITQIAQNLIRRRGGCKYKGVGRIINVECRIMNVEKM